MPVSADEFSRFAAAPPPRAIPPSIRTARMPGAPLLLAGLVALAATLGTWPLVAAVFPDRLVEDLRLDLGSTARIDGIAVAVEPTGQSLIRRDGGVEVERGVQRIRIRFSPPGQADPVEADCHSIDVLPEIGAPVGVEFVPGTPAIARIPGTTRSATPRIGAFVLALPAIAIAWLLRVLVQRRRVRHLLVHGRFALAEIVSVKEHRATLGPGRIEAALRTPDGALVEADFDLARQEGVLLRERAASTRLVGLLRDPDRPRRLLLTDTMLGAPRPAGSEPRDDGEIEDEDSDPDDPGRR
jgi:hypothetical protein